MMRDTLFKPTILLALALMAVIVMMVLPVPSWVVDIGLAGSFALAILMFTVTLFIQRPLDFSIFPTVLLASLMLRLSLNVSSTKLIIGEGHTGTSAAGQVIEGFAMFVMGGSVLLGVVIFSVLLIVNFVVITKGAGRMAEVGARFALDGMPGKQLAIDSDMSAGAINHEQARARREHEQAETSFFGSLDGASKFVKGDAVAGLLITVLNIVMGLVIGTVIHDMSFAAAFETYSILTVGDGLVSQIPAVIISIAAGLLLARGGASGATDVALLDQLGRHPAAVTTVAMLMALFAVVPGMPVVPFLAGAAALGYAAYRLNARAQMAAKTEAAEPSEERDTSPKPLGDMLDLDNIHVEFAPDLVSMVLDPAIGLDARISNMRSHVAAVYGLILPEIRLTDSAQLPAGHYAIRVQGVEQARDRLRPDSVLVLTDDARTDLPEGETVREPVYGAQAMWIPAKAREQVALSGATVVTPTEVLATHLLEVIRRNFARLLTLRSLRRLLDEFTQVSDAARAESNRRLLDELIPDKVPVELLLAVLRLLLEERVSIRNLPLILEAASEARGVHASAETVSEHVRQRLGFQIVSEIKRDDGTVPLIQLDPEWETTFAHHEVEGARGQIDVALPPAEFNRLGAQISEALKRAEEAGAQSALITSARRRRFLSTVVAARGLPNPVVSFEELGIEARPALLGMVAT